MRAATPAGAGQGARLLLCPSAQTALPHHTPSSLPPTLTFVKGGCKGGQGVGGERPRGEESERRGKEAKGGAGGVDRLAGRQMRLRSVRRVYCGNPSLSVQHAPRRRSPLLEGWRVQLRLQASKQGHSMRSQCNPLAHIHMGRSVPRRPAPAR